MVAFEFLVALSLALLIVALLGGALGRRGPWAAGTGMGGLLWFFLVVFFGAWAIGIWATPVGPVFMGVSWVPFLVGALVFGILLAGLSEPRARAVSGGEPATPAEAAVGGFFWLLILILLIAIVFGSL